MTGAPTPRAGMAYAWVGNRMLVWGGENDGLLPDGDGARYEPVTDTWAPITATGAPAARSNPSTVVAGREMIVWGGIGAGINIRVCRAGPATIRSPTPGYRCARTGPPARGRRSTRRCGRVPRCSCGAARETRQHGEGAGYTPATDSWCPILSAFQSPTPRFGHTAMWTGTSMLVWGGQDGTYLGTGSAGPSAAMDVDHERGCAGGSDGSHGRLVRHDDDRLGREGRIRRAGERGALRPARRRLDPDRLRNAPPARASHTAVWTGTAMMVWGGEGSGDQTPAGATTPGRTPGRRPPPPTRLPRAGITVRCGRAAACWSGAAGTAVRWRPGRPTTRPATPGPPSRPTTLRRRATRPPPSGTASR